MNRAEFGIAANAKNPGGGVVGEVAGLSREYEIHG